MSDDSSHDTSDDTSSDDYASGSGHSDAAQWLVVLRYAFRWETWAVLAVLLIVAVVATAV